MRKRMMGVPVAAVALVLAAAGVAAADSTFEVTSTQTITSFTNARAIDGVVTHHTQRTFGPMTIGGLGTRDVGTFEVLTRVLDIDSEGTVLGGSLAGSWVLDLRPFDLGKCRGAFTGDITEGFGGVAVGHAHCPGGEVASLTFEFGPGELVFDVSGSLTTP